MRRACRVTFEMVNTTTTSSSVLTIRPISINSIFGTAPASVSAHGFPRPSTPGRGVATCAASSAARRFGVRMVRMVEHDRATYHQARARPLQGLRLVLCRRVQPRSLRPAQAGLTSRLPPRPHRDWPSPGRTPIPIFRKYTAGSAHATATANEMAPKRPSSSPNAINSDAKKSCVYGRTLV